MDFINVFVKIRNIGINNNYINVQTKKITSRALMTGLLILKAFEEHKGITHMLTFSSINIDANKLFNILKAFSKNINIFVLSGLDSIKKRNRVIKEFKKCERAIICSARIFNEGVNIPIVNSVCFTDNKYSTVDIIQCCGRPLRLFPDKTMAYIILPTIINDIIDDNETNILKTSKDFSKIKAVLKALGSIDSRVIDEFDIKCKEAFNGVGKFITEHNNTINFVKNIDILEFNKSLMIYIYDKSGEINWLNMFKNVEKYIKETKEYPSETSDNLVEVKMMIWIKQQKCVKKNTVRGILTEERIKLLESLLDWQWEKDFLGEWEDKLDLVISYYKEFNRFPSDHSKDKVEQVLGAWIVRQKGVKRKTYKAGILTDYQINKIEEAFPNWKWDTKIEWIDMYNELKEFLDKHDRYPKRSIKEEESLDKWIGRQRRIKYGTIKDGILTEERIKSLEELHKWKWISKK